MVRLILLPLHLIPCVSLIAITKAITHLGRIDLRSSLYIRRYQLTVLDINFSGLVSELRAFIAQAQRGAECGKKTDQHIANKTQSHINGRSERGHKFVTPLPANSVQIVLLDGAPEQVSRDIKTNR